MPDRWPTVGRAEELDLIHRALDVPGTRCVVVSGAAGIGKTRLARAAAERARRARWRVRWATATADTRDIALGAMADLLPADLADAGRTDRFEVLALAQRALAGDTARALLVVDDASYLDEIGAALVRQLTAGPADVRLLLTARSDTLPEWLAHLALDDLVEHVRVEPLGEAEVAELVDGALAGTVDPATHAMLWTQSLGNPLWLRQLLHDGLDSGALAHRGGVWSWTGPPGAPSLGEVLATRLTGLPADQRAALDLVAFGEPLPRRVTAALALDDTLVALERRELVARDPADNIATAHPLLGALLRDRLDAATARTVRTTLIAALRGTGPRGADALRIARWQLEAGDTDDPDLLVTASRRTLVLDPVLAERFARAALDARPDATARYALARALLDQGRVDESAQAYTELLAGPLTPEQWAEAMMDSAYFALWVRQDAASGIEQLRAVEAASAQFRPQAASLRSAVALFSGATGEALTAGLPVVETSGIDPRVLHLAAVAVIPALTVAGRVGEAVALAERTRRSKAELEAERPGAVVGPTYRDAQLGWEYAWALRWAGRIDDAIADAAERLRLSAAEAVRHPESYGLRNAALGGAHLAAGDVRSALDALRVGAAIMRDADQVGTLVSCLADLARAEALAGDRPAAEALLAEAAQRRNPAVHLFEAELGRARALVAWCGGDADRARAEARAAAATARQWGQPVLEAEGLHLVVRFGDAVAVAARLAELAATTDAGLVSVFAEHAAAVAGHDPARLAEVADRFAAAGARLLAAESAADAARRYRGAGQAMDATRTARRSRALSGRCPDSPRPALLVEPAPLTGREREIAELARAGLSNAQIAERLVITARTVESHLQHAYAKLGLAGRGELADVTIG